MYSVKFDGLGEPTELTGSETPVAVTLRIDLLQDCGPSSGHLDGRVEHLQANPLDDATAGGPVRLAHQAGRD